jgi:threonine dehydrogenase-like Zn-dependent dehydrogenase
MRLVQNSGRRPSRLTQGRGADACIDAVGTKPDTSSGFDAVADRVKVATFLGTDRPHVLGQAIYCCRNFGTVSIVGVYGGFVDKFQWVPRSIADSRFAWLKRRYYVICRF